MKSNTIQYTLIKIPIKEIITQDYDVVIDRETEINNEYSYYKNLIPIIRNTKFDLVCVDGPFGFISKFPRQNILEIIDNRLLNE